MSEWKKRTLAVDTLTGQGVNREAGLTIEEATQKLRSINERIDRIEGKKAGHNTDPEYYVPVNRAVGTVGGENHHSETEPSGDNYVPVNRAVGTPPEYHARIDKIRGTISSGDST